MKKYLLFILFILFFISANAFAEKKMRVAIIDLQAKNVSNVVSMGVSNMIRSDFVDSGLFTVVERNQMKEIFKEQELQMTGCTDNACAVQVGKLLSARKIMVGEITKIGKAYYITVRIVDVEKGVAEFSSKEKAESDDTLDKAASTLTAKLIGRITGKTESQLLAGLEKRTMSGYWLRCIVPGWGQFYADRNIEGTVFSVSFGLGVAFAGYAYYNYLDKKKAYEDLPREANKSEYDSKYDDWESAKNLYNYSLIAIGVIYVAHWVDAIFFAKPNFGEKANTLYKPGPFIQIATFPGSNKEPEPQIGVKFGYRF